MLVESLYPENHSERVVITTRLCSLPSEDRSSQEAQLNEPSRSSEWQRARDSKGVIRQTHIGGQALLEGIMMRGRYNWAVAVRCPDGSIHTEEHELISGRQKNSWMYKPVIRGCTALVESLALGYQALQIATENAFSDEDDEPNEPSGLEVSSSELPQPEFNLLASDPTQPAGSQVSSSNASQSMTDDNYQPQQISSQTAEVQHFDTEQTSDQQDTPVIQELPRQPLKKGDDKESTELPKSLITISMIIGILLGIFIFVALPAILTNLLVGDYGEKTLLWNLVDGFIRIAIFVFYLFLIGRMPDIARMFGYHGAEHKTIHCYEHGNELTPTNASVYPTLHVRCGTAFMLMTMLIAILVFTLTPIGPLINALGVTNSILRFVLVVLSRIILMPVVGGLAYEVTVKWAGSHPENPLVQIVLWPGMQLQRLTTRQPDAGQLECAIAAMQLVLQREQREQREQHEADLQVKPA